MFRLIELLVYIWNIGGYKIRDVLASELFRQEQGTTKVWVKKLKLPYSSKKKSSNNWAIETYNT